MARKFVTVTGRPVEVAVYPNTAQIEYLTSDVGNQETEPSNQPTPEERYRQYDEAAMSNPANPYNATLGWISTNASLIPMAIGGVASPALAGLGIGGNIFGQIAGNKGSNLIYDNPDQEIKLNHDITVTPRWLTQQGLGLLTGGLFGKAGKYGMEEQTASGAEAVARWRRWSPYVEKVSTVAPKYEAIRNQLKSYLKTKYLGQTPEGLYRYRQLKVKPTDKALPEVENQFMKSGMYEKTVTPDGETVYVSPIRNEWITDLSGNVGRLSFFNRLLNGSLGTRDVAFDLMSLTPEEGIAVFYKNGGRLRKYGEGESVYNDLFASYKPMKLTPSNTQVTSIPTFSDPMNDISMWRPTQQPTTTQESTTRRRIRRVTKQSTEEQPVTEQSAPMSSDLIKIDIEDLLKSEGITSINGKPIKFGNKNLRAANASFGAKNSNHKKRDPHTGNAMAIDISIVGGTDKDYADFRQKLLSNPKVIQYMESKGWGIINEITPAILSRTRGTGKHFHFGPDTWAKRTWQAWRNNLNLPITQTV